MFKKNAKKLPYEARDRQQLSPSLMALEFQLGRVEILDGTDYGGVVLQGHTRRALISMTRIPSSTGHLPQSHAASHRHTGTPICLLPYSSPGKIEQRKRERRGQSSRKQDKRDRKSLEGSWPLTRSPPHSLPSRRLYGSPGLWYCLLLLECLATRIQRAVPSVRASVATRPHPPPEGVRPQAVFRRLLGPIVGHLPPSMSLWPGTHRSVGLHPLVCVRRAL